MKREDAIAIVKDGFEQLENALKAGRSDDLIRYLSTMSRFHNYSFRNMILIWMQNPDATMVAGFHAWKKLGRSVKKGEKGIAIFAPMPFKRKQDAAESTKSQDSDEQLMMGFKVVHVFDVEQTEGDALPELAKIGGRIGERLARIEQVVKQANINLVFENIDDGAKGYSSGGSITIEDGLCDVEKFAVIAHELAHEKLHQGENKGRATKTVRETEAEAVAFIVCTAYGLDTTNRSSDYIQLYNGDSDTLKQSLQSIQSTAQWMIESINAVEVPCDHSLQLCDDAGRLNGSWMKDESSKPVKYCCSVCKKFFGYAPSRAAANSEAV